MTFNPSMLSSALTFSTDRNRQEEEAQALRKQVRQKEAEFLKEKAILVQQVELLKMQLCESSEREANLKKINENIMTAFQQNQSHNKSIEIEITEDHPKVQDLVKACKQEYSQKLQREKERHREAEYQLERENQQIHFTNMDLDKKVEVIQRQYEFQTQEYRVLYEKYNSDLKHIEDKLKAEHDIIVKKLTADLDSINADIERQVILRLNQRYLSDQEHNEQIIKYQKEQQVFLEEQTCFRRKIEALEKEMSTLGDKLKKAEDENGSLRFKLKQQEKKHKEDLEFARKAKEEADKRIEQLENSRKLGIGQKKQSTTSASQIGVKTRNKTHTINNKENIAANKSQPPAEPVPTVEETADEEKNKLRRQISLLRCQLKKLEVDYRDLKSKSLQEIASLKDKLNVERKKRMNIYEDKIDKNNQMLQDLLDKDQTIFTLNRQISKLQKKLQVVYGGSNALNRTPNNLLGTSMQDSMYHQALAQSMVELFPNGQVNNHNTQTSNKRLISPLRSLDLTMLNKDNINNLNSLSFSLLPLQQHQNSVKRRNQRQSSLKKQPLTTSPQQIKRNRINSVHVTSRGSQNNLAASLNMIKMRNSRDGSIAEVNEDLYRDSVESLHGEDFSKLEQQQIRLQFDKPRKVQNYYTQRNNNNNDEELRNTLLGKQKEVEDKFYDSLDNNSQEEGLSENEEVRKFMSNYASGNQEHNWHTARVQSKKDVEFKGMSTNAPSIKKQRQRVRDEEDDCLVNILEHEDTHIEMQPTLVNTRQHLSTENLFRESQNTLETLQSFRHQNIQKQLRDVSRQKQASIPIPKPQKNSLKTNRLRESQTKFAFDSRKNSQKQRPDQMVMKSPSSPNIILNQQVVNSSSSNKRRLTRNDSCPSPLDEDETVLTLGSGEKLRIKETVIQNIEQYANKFKEQRTKFDTKPATNKNQSRQQESSFRPRTNSLINSVCSEISLKMKFIRDMPNTTTTTQPPMPGRGHTRVPSLKIPTGLGGGLRIPNTQR